MIEYHGLPREFFEPDVCWVRYAAATYRSAFDFTGTKGDFRILAEDPRQGFARFLFEWEFGSEP